MNIKTAKLTPLDIIIGLLVLTAAGYILYRIRIGLHYDWQWEKIPRYFFRYDETSGAWVPNMLMQGLFTTIRLSLWGVLLATLIGLVMGLCRLSHRLFWRLIGGAYVGVVRNLPPLVLIFIFYFFISIQIMPLLRVDELAASSSQGTQNVLAFLFARPAAFSTFLSALMTLAVFEGAYIAEIVRGGIRSIDAGQWEASAALGLNRLQQLRHVIFPQAVRRILPPLAGQFISTIKDSAIVSVISIQELTFQGLELMAATYLTFEIWITIAGIYLVLCLVLSLAVERLEIRLRLSNA
ncbi:MAG: amino acid ABC transporter permease [Thermodesulfobacteriota bacterium]